MDGFGGCNGAVKKNLEGSAALLWSSSMVGPTAYAVRSASQASLAAIYIVISTSTPTLFLLTTPALCLL